MTTPLRVLILEDRPADAELMLEELRRAGFEPRWERVETEADYLAGLDPGLDVILADYSLPTFGAPEALRLLQARGLDIPLIVVSGTLSDEVAVECMKQGAADYLLKDRLARLGLAVRQALEGRRLRHEERRAADAQARLQARLAESEKLAAMGEVLAGVLEAAADAVVSVDDAQRIIGFNRAAEQAFGYAAAEILGQPLDLLLPSRVAAAHREHLRAFAEAPESARFLGERPPIFGRRKDGTEFPAEASIVKLTRAGRTVFTAIVRDISERTQAEAALRESQRTLATLMENLPGMAYRCRNDPNWTAEFVSEGCLVLTGYHPADFLVSRTISCGQLIHPEDRDRVWDEVQAALAEKRSFVLLYRIRTATGAEKWVWEQGRGVVSPEGELLALEGFLTDITERKQAEDGLRLRTQELQTIADAQAAFLRTGDWREASAVLLRGALDQTGSEYGFAGAVVAGPVLRILAHEGLVWDARVNREFYEEAQRRYQEVGYLEFRDLDNLFGQVITKGAAVLSNDPASDPRAGGLPPGHPPLRSFLGVPMLRGTEVVGIIGVANRPGGYTDTERTRLEVLAQTASVLYDSYRRLERETALQDELRQAQKMEAVGLLAGGVAHDFNNLLTVISGRSHLLLQRLPPDDPLRRHVKLIETTAARAGALTQQLLAFSRKQALQPRVLDLNLIVADTTTILRRLIREDIELVTRPAPDLGRVLADPAQLEQVILNLVVNARDAMPQRGQLTIETANVELDEAFVRTHPGARPGPHVRLTVRDTGVGMDAATQARIFEPFFTTKARGQGTGLGLATVYGIVKQSRGYIGVESSPGRGTTFTVDLPRVEEAAETAETTVAPTGLPRGTETVLLVEDEEGVRDLAREVLEVCGYTVLEAPDPQAACRVGEAYEGPIDLLLTDVVMPQMGGRELADRLSTLYPGIRVLYMSGYTDDAIVQHGVLEGGVALLPKPFTPEALARKVRDLLDAREGR